MIKRLAMAMALFTLCLFAAPAPVSAFNPFGGVDCSDPANSESTVCSSRPPTDARGHAINPVAEEIRRITDIVAYIAGAAAIIIIIVSGFRLITSGSDVSTGSRTDTDIENARRGLANAVIGLAIIVLARTLIVFVLDKL